MVQDATHLSEIYEATYTMGPVVDVQRLVAECSFTNGGSSSGATAIAGQCSEDFHEVATLAEATLSNGVQHDVPFTQVAVATLGGTSNPVGTSNGAHGSSFALNAVHLMTIMGSVLGAVLVVV